jgi:hypothetical protein
VSNPTLPVIDPRAYIRTYVPVAWGALLGWLVIKFTAVASAIAWLDSVIPVLVPGTDWRELLNAATVAAVTALFYWGARKIGKRWPRLEKWLLGSSAVPVYTAR